MTDLFDFDAAPTGADPIDYAADSPDAAPAQESDVTSRLGELSTLAKKQLRLQAELINLEEQVKAKKRELMLVSCEDIPTLMAEVGLSKVALTDGSVITVGENLYASIPQRNKAEVAQWLISHGLGSIVRSTVAVLFDKGEKQQTDECISLLLAHGFEDVKVDDNMNTSSVKAAIKELMAQGVDVPLPLFGATIVKEAKIKLP